MVFNLYPRSAGPPAECIRYETNGVALRRELYKLRGALIIQKHTIVSIFGNMKINGKAAVREVKLDSGCPTNGRIPDF